MKQTVKKRVLELDLFVFSSKFITMKNFTFLTIFVLLLCGTSTLSAQYPSYVKVFKSTPNNITTVKGNLSSGKTMDDLSWASTSSMACFPGTQNTKFRGKHVLLATELPAYSEMTITVIPDDKSADMSIYAYQVSTSNFDLPPAIRSCVACEAEHKWDYKKAGKTQDHTRSVFFNSIDGEYNIVIGVAGANGLSSGGFTVKVDLKTRIDESDKQKPLKIYTAASQKGATKSYKGNLKDGVRIYDLSWAERSSVACFPGTQNVKFDGNHLLYTTDLPPYSVMTVELIPTNKSQNMSLYGYQVQPSDTQYPPNLSSCVTCEADHKWDYKKAGKTQDHTRKIEFNSIDGDYKIVIGVAGANGLQSGDFTLKISIE